MKKFVALVVVFCAMMISSTSSAAETIEELFERYTGWRCIYSDDNYAIHIYTKSIRRDYNYNGYVFHAFVRWVFTETGRQKELEQYRSLGMYLSKECYNLSSQIYLEYFNEINGLKYICTMKLTSYDSKGNIIPKLSYSKNEFDWSVITPGSVGEKIFDAVYARVPN